MHKAELLSDSETIKVLNKLGPLYHSYFGIRVDENGCTDCSGCDIETIKLAIEDEYTVYNLDTDEDLKDICDFDDKADYCIMYPYDDLIQESDSFIPYKTVIIKNGNTKWTTKPDYWYNKKTTWFTNYKGKLRSLPYLNTLNYITIDDPFEQVTVRSNLKGTMMTINDILFASRGLMADDTRTVDSYEIVSVSEDKKTLIIKANIDNWST